MRILKVYLDTSVISYLDQQDAPEKMLETRKLWSMFQRGQYNVVISDTVIREIESCKPDKRKILLGYLEQIDYTLWEVTDEMRDLANKFLAMGFLKQKSHDDCLHIAAAIITGCDIIVSWNFRHIVNVKTIRGVKILTTMEGCKELLIYSPPVLLANEEDFDEED